MGGNVTSVGCRSFPEDPATAAGWQASRREWPDIDVPFEEFAAHVERCTPNPHEQGSRGAIRWADLYIACACARGDAAAISAFETAFFGEVDAAAVKLGARGLPVEELRQLVRERLFVAEPGERPRILEYSGRGEFRGWVRIVATRQALNVTARTQREVPFDGDELAFVVGTGEDPELAFFRQRYAETFRLAFHQAFDDLYPRERSLIRYAFVQGLTIDAIAELYGVHRATAARWIVKAHTDWERLRNAARALGVSKSDYASMVRLIQSHFHITLERFLK